MKFEWMDMSGMENPQNPKHEEYRSSIEMLESSIHEEHTTGILLEAAEKCDYASMWFFGSKDNAYMERSMRLWQHLLGRLSEMNAESVELRYSEMRFAWINAELYKSVGQTHKMLEYYTKALEHENVCFDLLKKSTDLSDESLLFIGWNCLCLLEESMTDILRTDIRLSYTISSELTEKLKQLENCFSGRVIFTEKAARMYIAVAYVQDTIGEYESASENRRTSMRLFEQLIAHTHNSHYKLELIRVSIIEETVMLNRGASSGYKLSNFENDIVMLMESGIDKADAKAAKVLLAYVQYLKACIVMNSGNHEAALQGFLQVIQSGNEIMDFISNAAGTIEKDESIKITGAYLGALQSAGSIYRLCGEYYEAECRLKEALSVAERSAGTLPGTLESQVKSGCMLELALTALEVEDYKKLDYYAVNASEIAEAAAYAANSPELWFITAQSAMLVSEYRKNIKDRVAAAKFARTALSAFDKIAAFDPMNEILNLREEMEKTVRKGEKKQGFFSKFK